MCLEEKKLKKNGVSIITVLTIREGGEKTRIVKLLYY